MSPAPPAQVAARLEEAFLVGVLRAPDAGSARAMAAGAARAGLRCIEVTFTVPAAASVIARLRDEHPEVLVGAGTVTTTTQVDEAAAAGAAFAVSPHLSHDVLQRCAELDLLYVPGALTPTEVHTAAQLVPGPVKVFPVARLGGPAYVRDLLAPFPDLRLLVTGGVAPGEVARYRRAGARAVGLGSIFGAPPEELATALAHATASG